ncbi:hypothetical protein HMPREF9130_0418 [Peptoniphilus sp. oral taxon 375 str. F0436]|nr:hypothetical protein HMPREF9130_0418 [Peptoniphilus sp. oral taxon 375 str. F0436]
MREFLNKILIIAIFLTIFKGLIYFMGYQEAVLMVLCMLVVDSFDR